MTHICVSGLTIIDSDNGLSPGWCQAIILTNAEILLIGTNISEILIETITFSFKKMHLKVSSVKWLPFCLSLNVLKYIQYINSDSKVHGTNMGPTWVLWAPGGPHDGPMNLAIKEGFVVYRIENWALVSLPSITTHKHISPIVRLITYITGLESLCSYLNCLITSWKLDGLTGCST